MFAPYELLWALIGLILTILSSWLEAGVPWLLWQGEASAVVPYSLGVTFQVGAALFTGCMGGKNAAAIAQIAYVILGVVLFERFQLEIFTQDAGLSYLRDPGFGYLLGFIPAAWLCGKLAFRDKPTPERLGFAALSGLLVVHVCGLTYLCLGYLFRWIAADFSLPTAIMTYSIVLIPGQVMVTCAIALIAYGLRKALFY